MNTDTIVPALGGIAVLGLGLALLVYNVQRKLRRMKSQLRAADLRRRALRAAERS